MAEKNWKWRIMGEIDAKMLSKLRLVYLDLTAAR